MFMLGRIEEGMGEEGGADADKAGRVCIFAGNNWISWEFLSFIRHLVLLEQIHRDIIFKIIAGFEWF